MRAVVVHGAGDVRVEERPEPVAGPGEVVLDLEWGGLCGSDLSYWRHGASGTSVVREPLVLGHEVAGRVRALGPGVGGVEVGQPVTVHPATLVGDGTMPERLAGRTNLYPEVRYLGSAAFLPHTDGGPRRAGSRSGPTSCGRCPTASRPCTARWPSRSAWRCTPSAGPGTCAAATCWSTAPGRSARSWSPRCASPAPGR